MRKPAPSYRFSIVIPCYNESNFIANALQSLQDQNTAEKYEVIVVDNNCTDNTVKIAAKYGARIITERQPGVCAARQAGTKAAKGEIIISTDADTVFAPNWLTTIDNDFRADHHLIAIGGPCRYYDGPWWGKVYTHFLFGASYAYCYLVGHPFYMTATNIAFKKSAWSGYNLTLMQGGDELDLLHRLQKHGRVRFNNSNPTYTSGRRLSNGLLYNMFVTFLFYYLGAYYLDKIFKRNIIGAAPAFRKLSQTGTKRNLNFDVLAVLVVLFALSMSITAVRDFTVNSFNDVTITLSKIL